MNQLIYLSRHGTVRINKETISPTASSAFDLLEEGIKETRYLGTYLRKLSIENPAFIDSGLARTVSSTKLVAESMGIALVSGKNHHSSAALEEDVPWEGLTLEQKEGYYCGRHRRKSIKTARGLGEEVHQELYKIAESHPENNLIAILHGGINLGLIAYLTGQLKVMDNCGLYVLEKSAEKLNLVGDYISSEQMRKLVQQEREYAVR